MTTDPPAAPTIHEAYLTGGPSGAVESGPEIAAAETQAQRAAGRDVVVRSGEDRANRSLAYQLESAVGPALFQFPHQRSTGPMALPHFQQQAPPPRGHAFYEVGNRKARKKS